jgi:hypothetical protein
MNRAGTTLWTIHQLSAEIERALGGDYSGVSNGRVRDVPDLRTIRYYTTLGLLDRPAEMRGRTALYGTRHLLQLVAIKRLQAQGLSLAQVQSRLTGAPDAVLRKISGVNAGATAAASNRSAAAAGEVDRPSFWKARPAASSASPPPQADSTETGPPESSSQIRSYEEMTPLHAIGLGDGVTMLLPAMRPIDPEDLAAIRKAAALLLKSLRLHQLIPSTPKGDGDGRTDSPTD